MSVWYCIPSARPAAEAKLCLDAWRDMGYKVALWLDSPAGPWLGGFNADVVMGAKKYPGYARAVNTLIAHVMSVVDPQAEWFVTGGDDVWPDPKKRAEEIAAECSKYFADTWWAKADAASEHATMSIRSQVVAFHRDGLDKTFGVMQPTGDRWHEGKGGFANAPIDRVCGSPWMGREFCRRINQGRGPLWDEYEHMFEDEELQCVAEKYGILWQRRDLEHKHQHWGRGATDQEVLNDPAIPEHLQKWNTGEHWQKAKGIFTRRKAAGFPGSEPIA